MLFSRDQYPLLFIVIFCFLLADSVRGQNNRVENFIKAGPEDAETLTRAYLKPYATGIGGSLNTGWFNTASIHKPLGFDIQIRGALAVVPSTDQRFNVNALQFERIEIVDGEPSYSPTGAGHSQKGPSVIVRDNGRPVARFNLPQGSGFNYAPAPLVQGSLGLIKNTDLTLRFVPEVQVGAYVNYNMQGAGIKHSVSQWLAGAKLLPFDVSVFAGVNHVDLTAHFDLDPPEPDPNTNYNNQRVNIDFNTFTTKLVIGKDLRLLSFYGAFGYETSTMDLAVKGNYPMPVWGSNDEMTVRTITDPFAYSEAGKNKYSASGGITFKLSFVRIFGEFTYADYPIGNAGFGFSFR